MAQSKWMHRFLRLVAVVLIGLGANRNALADGLPTADAIFSAHDAAEIELGQLLFYDPVLSGSRGVSCATCHHPRFGTADGVSLGLGDGGKGLGMARTADPDNMPEHRVPRNATALFNLGATEFTRMFHDGRLEADDTRPSGLRTPIEDEMVAGFDSALAAQAMFPVLSPDEMAGHYSENDVAKAVRRGQLTGKGGAWEIIALRVSAIAEYRRRFDEVLGAGEPIEFTAIANAIAAFIAFEWRADDSPFDRYLRDGQSLSDPAMAGMTLFFGEAGCSTCHAGQFQTDHDFHAIAMPQIGPGKAARFETHFRDTGRMRVTGDAADAYRFRTPSLRNITATAPYGHAGTYANLEAVIRHHLDPVGALNAYDPSQAILPELPDSPDLEILSDPQEMAAIAGANELLPQDLSDNQVAQIIAFLHALSDPVSLSGRLGIPERVPSGLPVDQ